MNNSRFAERHVLRCNRAGRITLGMWGWMSRAGPGQLTEISGRMDAEEYINILETVMVPSVQAVYGNEPLIYIQDNSAVHTSRLVRNWFGRHPQFTLLRWPAKSPDLNPIENLWGYIVREWDDEVHDGIRHRNALFEHATNLWERYRYRPSCQHLVDSMQRRLQETIANNGLWTKY
ncbi:DDE superfamily endonuclease [Popillia japonica]